MRAGGQEELLLTTAVDWLSHEDVRILTLEGPTVAGHTCKVIELAGGPAPLSLGELRAHVERGLDAVPRLRRRLELQASPQGKPAWVKDTHFDLSKHVLELPLGGPVDREGLRDIVAALMRARLDRSRPLWTMHLVPELSDGGSALVLRVHHALADGATALRICAAIAWEEDDAQADPAPPSARSHTTKRAGEGGRATARGSSHHHAVARELVPASGRSQLGVRISARRAVAFAQADLAELRAIAHGTQDGATVNDVVLCAVAGGLRRGLLHGGRMPRLRAKVPVSLHRPGEDAAVANRDSFMCVDLDVAEEDPARRLEAIHNETTERKVGGDADVLDALLHGASRWRRRLAGVAGRWSMSPRVLALNVSNVRGPEYALAVADRPVAAVYSLAEVANRHALRVACISTCGKLTFGLCADADALPDLPAIAAGVEAEVAALRGAVAA